MGFFRHVIFLFFGIKISKKLYVQPRQSFRLLCRERAKSLILYPLIIFFSVLKLKTNQPVLVLITTIKWLGLNEKTRIDLLRKNYG